MNRTPGGANDAPLIDILRESELWKAEPDAETIIRRAIMEAQCEASSGNSGIAIVLTDDSEMRKLNRTWRSRDEPTNVLSFPAHAGGNEAHERAHLGDIVIAFETVSREAAAQSKPLGHHLAHLAIHGYLHLLGYDHESDSEADAMERLETAILGRLGISDPYANSDPQ